MKNLLLFVTMASLVGSMGAAGQEKTADPKIESVSFPVQQAAYSANDMKILGTLDNGPAKLVDYSNTPEYRAFVFGGNGHDRVEITVTGASGPAFIALADQSLNPIASGVGRLSITLPYHGPDTEAFYIIFKANGGQASRLAVHLKAIPSSSQSTAFQPTDATR